MSANYLAPAFYFAQIMEAKAVILEAQENYQKRTFRNRMHLVGANGPFVLSVPLKKGKNKQVSIKDVLISYDDQWVNQHLKSIKSAYHSSPYFDYIFPELEDILKSKLKFLYDLNMRLLLWVFDFLDWPIDIIETKDYFVTYEKLKDFRKGNEEVFSVMPYSQVFEDRHGFLGNLSILDLLFCLGKESKLHLMRHNKYSFSKNNNVY